MPSLKETKTRIGSVKGTLKITSAMKLVASAKLHKAQQAVAGMLPYQKTLYRMLSTVAGGALSSGPDTLSSRPSEASGEIYPDALPPRIAILAVSSNSSLCGGFNANVVRKLLDTLREYAAAGIPDGNITVIPIGRKMADALRRIGRPSAPSLDAILSFRAPSGAKESPSTDSVTPGQTGDLNRLIDRPSFSEAAAFAEALIKRFQDGDFDRIELVYNHFVSTASQVPTRETWLPFTAKGEEIPSPAVQVRNDKGELGRNDSEDRLWLFEPSREALVEELLPKLMRLKIYTMLLDSSAAEHAARTVAMQMATDNGEEILEDLTLEYNKARQQKITSEILDIVGGSMQE